MKDSKTTITMTALVLLFIGGSFLGFQLLTSTASTVVVGPTCEDRTVAEGETLTTNFVTVNVYNSGQRSGIANRAHINLQRNGFLAGEIGNSPGDVEAKAVTILTDDQEAPAVRLVAAQFKNDVEYVEPVTTLEDGVTIVLGDDFNGLEDEPARETVVEEAVSFCVPLDPEVPVE